MAKKRLPMGVPTFREVREGELYYVDKTEYIHLLTRNVSKHFILSRPRRFGKSLFLDTLGEAFEGSEELFEGLALHGKWDWSARHPVIRLSFASGKFRRIGEVCASLDEQFDDIEDQTGLKTKARMPAFRLRELIRKLYAESGQGVVLLVDEYDKPITDALMNPEIAEDNRDELSAMYGVTKDVHKMLRFSFFTGVTRFAKTGLSSGMNNVVDISLRPEYSAVCGYTESELGNVFATELEGLDRNEIREWYNGYSWLGREKVYNPWDILNLLDQREYLPWWVRSGSSTSLIEILKKHRVMSVDLSNMKPHGKLLESFDINVADPESLLFQYGYLTIAEKIVEDGEARYRLDYPNREVRQNLNEMLLEILLPDTHKELLGKREDLRQMLLVCDVEGMKNLFQAVFAGIPRQWHSPVDLTKYESYVASSFYSYFMGAGLIVGAEVATSQGRLDMSVTGPTYVYVFEFKIVEGDATGEAIKQAQEKGYAQMYQDMGKTVYLAGVEFSKETRTIVGFDAIKADDTQAQPLAPNTDCS